MIYYSKKKGVVFSKIYAPENAPNWVYDREELWNRVTSREQKKDGQLAEIINKYLEFYGHLGNVSHLSQTKGVKFGAK
ncbi:MULTISPECIES: MobA/MobL family protein [unclassified Candidatus Tisiphia]|uniref:MobA/MobL family protein n=1 Tax=unclassified Candidatus Tisiphia TaxID=2996318 RepID=UPI00312CB0A5